MKRPDKIILSVIFLSLFLLRPQGHASSSAKEVTLLYTGQMHSMLYPCNCPKEPDGGVARMATLVKELRIKYPGSLLLDSGNFFAGGLMDEYTQSASLDMKRTHINLAAMKIIGYDAVNIGEDELNFGKNFLKEAIDKAGIIFLSSNLEMGEKESNPHKHKHYIIKDVSGVKIGIIGLTAKAATQKSPDIDIHTNSLRKVEDSIKQLKKQGAEVIILLSNASASEESEIINKTKGINIIISGRLALEEKWSYKKINDILLLKPTWQGRRLGKTTLFIKEGNISDYKVEEIRLSEKIADDPEILKILPRCFSDRNCKKKGYSGICNNPATLNSACTFKELKKIKVTVINSSLCRTCNNKGVIDFLNRYFPNLELTYVNYPGKKAARLIDKFKIWGLPAYLLEKDINKESGFESLKNSFIEKGRFYILKPEVSGVTYMPSRKKIKGRLDVFLSLYDKNTADLLKVIKEFKPSIHFLALEDQGKFDAKNGQQEVEECLRAVCVKEHFPREFWDYLSCRANNISSSWWDECLIGMDLDKVRSCARGKEGASLLRENIGLNGELQVLYGPAYLVDNQEVFSSKGVPSKKELKEIIER